MGEQVISTGAILIFLMLMFYMTCGAIIETYHIKFGHEASITVLMGMLISYIEFVQGNTRIQEMLEFSDETFFFFCLPPIVFASGFNMHRGDFFGNIGNVMLFGVLGTFVAFFSFSAMTIGLKNWLPLMQYKWDKDGSEWNYVPLTITDVECMLFCSLMCSSDVVAAVSIVSYQDQPKLFSIVFGEGITNDAVSIILFNAVLKFTTSGKKMTAGTPLKIMTSFSTLAFKSLFIGIIFALLSAWVLKRYRMFSKNPVMESMMIFCFGYISYVASEGTENSGIITLLTCGVLMAHYTWYNLSPQGKQSSFIVFQFLGYATEAFVFAYLGLTLMSYTEYEWSPQLFAVELGVILVGRCGGTLGLVYLFKCFGYDAGLTFKEIVFIWYAGMIRGAIAFGLVLRINGQEFENKSVIVTTSLLLVIFTTVFCGSTVAVLQRILWGDVCHDKTGVDDDAKTLENKDEGEEAGEGEKEDTKETPLLNNNNNENLARNNESTKEYDVYQSDSSYEDIYHPNDPRYNKKKHVHKGCAKYLNRFDEMIMRPIFIYRYEKNMMQKSREFIKLFMRHGEEIEEDFYQQNNQGNIEEDTAIMAHMEGENDNESKGSKSSRGHLVRRDSYKTSGHGGIASKMRKLKVKVDKENKKKDPVELQETALNNSKQD